MGCIGYSFDITNKTILIPITQLITKGELMKFFAGFLVALAVTIVWQTTVISGEEANPVAQKAIDTVQQENQAAGRAQFEPGDCD